MTDVVRHVREVSALIGKINASADDQNARIAQVGDAVGTLDANTQDNAVLVDNGSAAAQSLEQQVASLTDAIAAFHLEVLVEPEPESGLEPTVDEAQPAPEQ
jgi:methyl-accepting chemotaxis protein